ncbi:MULTISPECIES: MarC family protein [Silvimonas]|uniref:MarC family protein n=1 Tax=Silvimonas TaxID=300264 RepID=UPI0024B358A8|nr:MULTISPECIES: MarC family protein [Silvimonas]MDR3427641.1 MarC family protein [Silvimonas sp.]
MQQFFAMFLGKIILVIVGLIPILNPLGAMPIFLSLTERYTSEERAILARRIAFFCFCLLLFSMFIGSYVLDFFGVSIPIVRVCGGLLVASAGWKLLNSPEDSGGASEPIGNASDHARRSAELQKRAFYPLTFPFTVGPGSITVAITLGVGIRGQDRHQWDIQLASAIGVAVLSAIIYVCYRYGDRLLKLIGSTGTVVFLRLSAFILLCLGAQIFWDGASGLAAEFLTLHPWQFSPTGQG